MNTLSNKANPENKNQMLIEEIENLKLQRSLLRQQIDSLQDRIFELISSNEQLQIENESLKHQN
jgi:regulator of replication initiation timing